MRRAVSCLLFSLNGITQGPSRRVFDFDAEYWPTSNHEPFASFINSTPEYVASTTLTEVSWQNATLIKGSPAEQIVRLRAQAGQNIGVHGGARVVQPLPLAYHPLPA